MNAYIDKLLTYVLTPASWLYNAGVGIHNWLFDANIRSQKSFDIPVISVGNIAVGGTGKTPHVEYIIEQLKDRYNIAVLSRGYRRKTKGFILASPTSTPSTIGDEPYQIYRKFEGDVKVAVTKNRKRGIEKIQKLFPEVDLIILDDAYQYRNINPLISILLMDYQHPIDKDHLLPLGRLREPQHSTDRADMIIVTKCPERLNPFDYRTFSKTFNFLSFQKLFFSSISYRNLKPVFPENANSFLSLESLTENDAALLITGIAQPRGFVRFFKNYPFKVRIMNFPDHHNFTRADLRKIKNYYSKMEGKKKIIITTEKDSVRLLHNPYFPYKLKKSTYYLPIKIQMHPGIDGDVLGEQLELAIRNRHLNR